MSAIVNLLCILCTEYPELKLIGQLNTIHNIDYNLFLLNPSTDTNLLLNARRDGDLTPYSSYVFHSVGDKLYGLESMVSPSDRSLLFKMEYKRSTEVATLRNSKNALMIVVPESGRFEENVNLLKKVKEIQTLKLRMKIGFVFHHAVSGDDLQKLFRWFWKKRIVNVFVAVERSVGKRSLNLFTYNPIGGFRVINITADASTSVHQLFLSSDTNLQQHSVKMGHNFNKPRDEKLWRAVFNVMNCSFTISTEQYTDEIESLDNEVYVFPQLFVQIHPWNLNMYPMLYEWSVIVVPESLPYSAFSAYLLAMASIYFFVYLCIVVVATIALLIVIRYLRYKKFEIFRSVANVLNLLMNDNGAIRYQLLPAIEALLIVPLTFVGLVFVIGIFSTLQNYLIRPILQPQIDSIEDIYRSSIRITTTGEFSINELMPIFNSKYPGDWQNKFTVMADAKLWEQKIAFIPGLSFQERNNYANILIGAQRRLGIKGYHISKLLTKQYILSYGVNDEFPFVERFNEIIHWIRSAGLYDVWLAEEHEEVVRDVVARNRRRVESEKSKEEIERFPIPMFIVYGWVSGAVVLVIEIFWKNAVAFIIRRMKNQRIDRANTKATRRRGWPKKSTAKKVRNSCHNIKKVTGRNRKIESHDFKSNFPLENALVVNYSSRRQLRGLSSKSERDSEMQNRREGYLV